MTRHDRDAPRLLEGLVTVADVATSGLICIPADATAEQAIRLMEHQAIKQAPIQESPITRCVVLDELKVSTKKLAVLMRDIKASELVSASASLATLLPHFRQRAYFYVQTSDHIAGIVTRADLQLPPVSTAVLGLLLRLKQALTPLIDMYTHGDWLKRLDRDRAKKLQRRFEQREVVKTDLSPLQCLDFVDHFEIVGVTKLLLHDLEYSRQQWNKLKEALTLLRNTIANGGRVFAVRDDLARTLDKIAEVQALTDKAWALSTNSPFMWDAYVGTELRFEHAVIATVRAVDDGEPPVAAPTAWPSSVFVLTAHNPGGRRLTESETADAMERLKREVETCTDAQWPAIGASRVGSWQEHSIACSGATREAMLDIARRYGQRAIFELCDCEIRVIDCESGSIRRARPAKYTG
ncbi:MAG: DUF3293 domain-containing protein [Rhodobacterales bacterium]|nr:DUF3293 domain-containing protein [Rhodobacterales bacterium]